MAGREGTGGGGSTSMTQLTRGGEAAAKPVAISLCSTSGAR